MTSSDGNGSQRTTSGFQRWLRRLLRRRERVRDARKARTARRRAEENLDACLHDCVAPALAAVRDKLNEEGYTAALERDDRTLRLRVVRDEEHFCIFTAEGRLYHKPSFAFPALHGNPGRPQSARVCMGCEGGEREWDLRHCGYEAIYEYALSECHKWLDW